MNESKYTVRGYATADTARGCDCETGCDTLAGAKIKARDYVTERLDNEFSPMAYATVTNKRGECVWDVSATKNMTTLDRINNALPKGMRVIQREIDGVKCVFFRYNRSGIDFEFSMLCECPEAEQDAFDKAAHSSGCTFLPRSIQESPFEVTVIQTPGTRLASAESRRYSRHSGREGENSDLFPENVGEWAEANSDEIAMTKLEIEETPNCIEA